MKTLILVSCCGEKRQQPAPAKELYQSNLFRLARRYAEGRASSSPDTSWVILSALLGVVHPDRVIEPYEQRMWTTRARRDIWADGVEAELLKLAGGAPTRFVSLCGRQVRGERHRPLGRRVEHVDPQRQRRGAPVGGHGDRPAPAVA